MIRPFKRELGAFGFSPSSVSRQIIHATVQKLKEFTERNLKAFRPFAIFLDTIHRGKEAFIVVLGLQISSNILFTYGGSGVIKSLRDRFGSKLMHQRCTIHKDRNIQGHLAKQHRRQAHRLYRIALEQESYEDAS